MSGSASIAEVLPPEALADASQAGALSGVAEGAEAIACPESMEEVVEVVRWAAGNDVGVLPVGSAERVRPVRREGRFIVLSTRRLKGLEIYEPGDLTLTARAGTPLVDIDEALSPHRQWLPFDPPGGLRRTLGGLVAAGESGPSGTGYGELRSHVLGATVVCGDGRVLRLGGRVVKNVAGFDLLRPVVGSRGRLGVVTSVCVRAFPEPSEDRVLVRRDSNTARLATLARSVRTAPVLPVSSVLWVPARAGDVEAALLVRLQGAPATVEADQQALERHAGIDFERLDPAADIVERARDGALGGAATVRISVLASKLFEAIALVEDRLGEVEVVADAYTGIARVAIDHVDSERLRALRDEVESLGGVLTVDESDETRALGEVSSRLDEAEVALTSRIEQVFDPTGVFWPCRA